MSYAGISPVHLNEVLTDEAAPTTDKEGSAITDDGAADNADDGASDDAADAADESVSNRSRRSNPTAGLAVGRLTTQ